MPAKITINYQEMRDVAREFQNQSQQTQQILQSLNNRAQQLMAGWEGVAEEAFMQELQSCQQRLNKVPEMLSQISQALARTADTVEQAEQQAASHTRSSITADN